MILRLATRGESCPALCRQDCSPCTRAQQSSPILNPPTLEHGLSRFANIDDDLVWDAFPEALRRHREKIRAIADNVDYPTW